jgi:hypothetical protein
MGYSMFLLVNDPRPQVTRGAQLQCQVVTVRVTALIRMGTQEPNFVMIFVVCRLLQQLRMRVTSSRVPHWRPLLWGI